MNQYDAVIIGSGLSGLSCGVMLAKEGLKVCVVEQHTVCGGCLQSFTRGGKRFDTGFHYVGSLDEGQILRQYFKYFGINDKVSTLRLDDDAFETLNFYDKEYKLPLGKEQYINQLTEYFPEERQGIKQFVDAVFEVKDSIGVELLQRGIISLDEQRNKVSVSTCQTIENCVKNPILRGILAGNTLLYGGERETSNFYSYSMVVGTNIEGSYKIIGGTQTIADALVQQIRSFGGDVFCGKKVTRIAVNEGTVSHIEFSDGDKIFSKNFISSLHPKLTFNMLDRTPSIKKAYITRMNELNNTYGVFSVYITLKPHTLPYRNTNIYIHPTEDTWSAPNKIDKSLLICMSPTSDMKWADTVTLLIPMYHSEVALWNDTQFGKRSSDYEDFKLSWAEKCINIVETHYPGFQQCVDRIFTSSPLTFRDYTSTPDGTAYGIVKSFVNPLPTMFSVRTKIPNLFLTGQSIYVHGGIGVILTSTLTCAEILGSEYIAQKISQA